MKVILDKGLFVETALVGGALHLLMIFRLGFEQRHAVVLGFDRGDAPVFDAWLKQRPAYEQDEIEGALRYGLQSEARDVLNNVVWVAPEPEPQWSLRLPRVPPALAADLLVQPLELLVEDAQNDRAFLRAMAVAPVGASFERFLGKQWIRFSHGGGVPSMIREVAAKKDRPGLRLRTWVIFDSDSLSSSLPLHDASQQLLELCAMNDVSFHYLWRRAMENYLPPDFLLESLRGKPHESAARAFYGLRKSDQRHYYNMKKGFDGDRARLAASEQETKDAVSALFQELSQNERKALRCGFGRQIGELFRSDDGRRPLGLTEEMLLKDGIGQEMDQLFEGIMAWV